MFWMLKRGAEALRIGRTAHRRDGENTHRGGNVQTRFRSNESHIQLEAIRHLARTPLRPLAISAPLP